MGAFAAAQGGNFEDQFHSIRYFEARENAFVQVVANSVLAQAEFERDGLIFLSFHDQRDDFRLLRREGKRLDRGSEE